MILLAAIVALAACELSESNPPADADTSDTSASDTPVDAWVEIGTGFPSYEPLVDGQEVPIIQGIQGGYHVWGGFRVSGLDTELVQIDFQATVVGAGDRIVARATYEDDIGRDGPVSGSGAAAVYEYAAVAVIFGPDETRDIATVSDVDLHITLTLTDQFGVSASDSITVRTRCCEL